MSTNKNVQFKALLNSFLEKNKEIEAIIVSDVEGFVIAGEKRKDIDIEIVSFLTAVVNPILERIRHEFAFQKFGTASFDTDKHRLLFISVSDKITLSLVVEALASIDRIAPYAYFLAEKTAQFIETCEEGNLKLFLPDFECGTSISENIHLKEQIYQDLKQGRSYSFKFIIIGDHEVGKTSIIRRFVDNKYSGDYRATIGLNIVSHDFEAFDNKINLTLWDIGAQEYFKRYRQSYYNGAKAVFIVFDLTNRKSFENVKIWYNELKEFLGNKELPIIIVGNKSDKTEERVVKYEEGFQLASDLSILDSFSTDSELSKFSDLSSITDKSKTKISYMETSAKTGEHILDAFTLLSYHYVIKSWEIEEENCKKVIFEALKDILEDKKNLTLTFITEDPLYNPGLQILTSINQLGKFSIVKEKSDEKIYQYSNGLLLKVYNLDGFKISDCDGVFCFFDSRNKECVEKKNIEYAKKIVQKIKKNKVVSIGIRVSKNVDWSKILESFDINAEADKNQVSLLFFKICLENRLELFEPLGVMLNTIKNVLFNY